MSTDSIEHKIIANYIYYQCTRWTALSSVLPRTNAPLPFLPNIQIWKPILLQFFLFLSCPEVTAPRTPDSNIIFIFTFYISTALFYHFFLLNVYLPFCFFRTLCQHFFNFHVSLVNLSIPYLIFSPFLFLIYLLLSNELGRFLLYLDYARIDLPQAYLRRFINITSGNSIRIWHLLFHLDSIEYPNLSLIFVSEDLTSRVILPCFAFWPWHCPLHLKIQPPGW